MARPSRRRRLAGPVLGAVVVLATAGQAQDASSPEGRLVDLPPEEVLEAARHMSRELTLPSLADMDAAVEKGVGYLVTSQAEDGSWGGWQQPGPYDGGWSNKYSHIGWQIATTGLVAMALMEQPETPPIRGALERSLHYLLGAEVPKRPSDWDTDNTWGMVYGLAGLATALEDPRYGDDPAWRPRLEAKVVQYLERLAAYQTPSGGWGYYDFETLSVRPSWATSFMTSAALVALEQARRLELQIPDEVLAGMPDGSLEGMLDRAVTGLARCRLPNGAYGYSLNPVPSPGRMEGINNVRGSLGRIQAGNFALAYAGFEDVERDDLLAGLDRFFEHHRFLDVARKRPIPHEAYYANAGYFYFFGHYYAGRVLELLDPAERVRYQARLAREVIKTQESDGSMWDYYMNSYHRPYGTAFGLMTLKRCLPDGLQLAPR